MKVDNAEVKDLWSDSGVTVGQLRKELLLYPEDANLVIGPDRDGNALRFLRVKSRGDDCVQIELS